MSLETAIKLFPPIKPHLHPYLPRKGTTQEPQRLQLLGKVPGMLQDLSTASPRELALLRVITEKMDFGRAART